MLTEWLIDHLLCGIYVGLPKGQFFYVRTLDQHVIPRRTRVINTHLKIPRFPRTGTASAILNSLNDHVNAPFRKSYTFSRGNQWSTREFAPGKNGETGKFLWSLTLLIRPEQYPDSWINQNMRRLRYSLFAKF